MLSGRPVIADRESARRLKSLPPAFAEWINLTRYVSNNPVNDVDPSGLSGISKLGTLIRRAIREASKDAIKRGIRDELRNQFYMRMGKHLADEGISDIVRMHHLIAQKFFGESAPKISRFLEDIGILEHSAKNITTLPNREALRQGFDVGEAALHEGGHLAKYFDDVKVALLEIMDTHTAALAKAGKNLRAIEGAKETAQKAVRQLQSDLRKKLQSGEIKLQAYDTPETRRNLITGIVVVFVAAGLTTEEAEAATMDFVENQIENESYYREKNVYVRYGTAGYYTHDSDSGVAGWAAFAVDFFNPVEDVVFVTDLAEDAIRSGIRAVESVEKLAGDVAGDIGQSAKTIQTNPNAKINLERQLLMGGPALPGLKPRKPKPTGWKGWLIGFFWGN